MADPTPEGLGGPQDGPDRLPALLPPGNPLGTVEGAQKAVGAYLRALTAALTDAVVAARAERAARLGDLPVGRADVADLVRRLARFADTLDVAAAGLRDVARASRDEIGEEITATGETRLVIPDGQVEIVARVARPRQRVVDTEAMANGLAALRLTERLRADLPDNGDYMDGYRQAMLDVGELSSRVNWSVTKVDGLARSLSARGADDLAGLIERAMRWVQADDEQVIVRVEEPKRSRRA